MEPNDAGKVMDEVSEREGWDEVTKLQLCLDYISEEGSAEEFKRYLESRSSDGTEG